VLSAIVYIVASQVVLAGLLFATTVIDRPSPHRLRRRPADPVVTVRAHQRRIASLRAAAERSHERTVEAATF
jgi:hypothetical protein